MHFLVQGVCICTAVDWSWQCWSLAIATLCAWLAALLSCACSCSCKCCCASPDFWSAEPCTGWSCAEWLEMCVRQVVGWILWREGKVFKASFSVNKRNSGMLLFAELRCKGGDTGIIGTGKIWIEFFCNCGSGKAQWYLRQLQGIRSCDSTGTEIPSSD